MMHAWHVIRNTLPRARSVEGQYNSALYHKRKLEGCENNGSVNN